MPHDRSIGELMAIIEQQFDTALATGFDAVKMEVLFGDLVSDAELVEQIRIGRRMLGDGIAMALDFGYRWKSWADARWVLDRVADCDIYFAEAPLQHDDLLGHARLAANSPIRIGGAEFGATRFEAREWLEVGKVHVIQSAIDRAGGLTELRRICELAELYGADVIPHGWKTGITSACGRHLQAACPQTPLFEYISPDGLRFAAAPRPRGARARDRERPHAPADRARPRHRAQRRRGRLLSHRPLREQGAAAIRLNAPDHGAVHARRGRVRIAPCGTRADGAPQLRRDSASRSRGPGPRRSQPVR